MAKGTTKITNGNGETSPAVADEKKRQASKSVYLNKPNEDGSANEPSRSPTANTIGMRFSFLGISEPLDCMFDDLPDDIRNIFCVAQGANIKVQRSFNTAKGNPSQMREEASDAWDNLVSGAWTSEREGGLRIGDLADAIKSTLESDGETVSDERFARIKETLKDEGKRDKAKNNPQVKAALATIVANKAAARAAEANEALATATVGDLGDFA